MSLRLFITQPHVRESRVWEQLFQSMPPRGVVARIARRLEVDLDVTEGFWSYLHRGDFINEIESWISYIFLECTLLFGSVSIYSGLKTGKGWTYEAL